MTIKTRYDVGDECWIMFADKPRCMKINGVIVENDENEVKTKYTFLNVTETLEYTEDRLFETKEDLIKSL